MRDIDFDFLIESTEITTSSQLKKDGIIIPIDAIEVKVTKFQNGYLKQEFWDTNGRRHVQLFDEHEEEQLYHVYSS